MPLNVEMVRAAFPGRRIVWLDVCSSTMREASRLAAEGAPSGAAVVCEEQTAGQGRHGRVWRSERASGLYVSVVLRPGLPEASAPLLTLALGLAAGEAIARASGLGCDLRWPNDVLIGGKKCAGILVQAQGPAFIAGIGINVNHAAFPPELAPLATSLRLASGRPHSRELLLVGLLRAVDSFTRMLAEGGPGPLLRAFAQASSYARGKRVVAGDGESLVEGVTDGLDPSGFLYIRKDDGTRTLVLSGGLRPAE
ncbi:MAG: biotin--[acetyl-CoA-carboxylase] ligase [Bryobacteraceae bacterium]|jgi:BirA family biotin operon repressor/biotin-[acetyl-CoA-carboxylase] ligase